MDEVPARATPAGKLAAIGRAESIIPATMPVESEDLMMSMVRRFDRAQHLHLVVSFAGQVDAERLGRAVRLTVDAEPILGCRLVLGPAGATFERRADLDETMLYQVSPLDGDAVAAREALLAAILEPDPDDAPMIGACLFRFPELDVLHVRLAHDVVDGGGTKEYAYLLAETYRRLGAEPDYQPAPNIAGSRGLEQVFRQVAPELLTAPEGNPLDFFSSVPAVGFPCIGTAATDPICELRQVAPERFRTLQDYGRAHQATVNDVLLTAFCRAFFELAEPPAGTVVPIQVPIDLRRYLPGGRAEALANLWGRERILVPSEPGATFEQTLATVLAATTAMKDGAPGVQLAMMLDHGAKQIGEQAFGNLGSPIVSARADPGSLMRQPTLTNIGVLDERRFDFGEPKVDDAFVAGPLCPPGSLMVGVSTFRDTLMLSYSYYRGATAPTDVERFFDTFVAELPGEGLLTATRSNPATGRCG